MRKPIPNQKDLQLGVAICLLTIAVSLWGIKWLLGL